MIAMRARVGRIALVAGALTIGGCTGHTAPAGGPPNEQDGFSVVGDPQSPRGATWTFRGTVAGTRYDLHGVLLKPRGAGPFPAVILSHGSRGNAAGLASLLGPTMVQWGLVCIAVDYTHSEGVPIGRPGDEREPGASEANVKRAQMTYELLRQLGYVDMSRVALHGHSMGAWVSAAVASAWPDEFRVASTTGGGVRPPGIRRGPAPSEYQVRGIRIPFLLQHGASDETVPVENDERFSAILAAHGVEHELDVYPGEGHLQVRASPMVLGRIRAWYAAHGMFGGAVQK
jgi:dienelactone hydrolase